MLRKLCLAVSVALCLSATMNLAFAAPVAASSSRHLGVPGVQQQTTKWCWAASNNSILRYVYNDNWSQCDQASAHGGRSCCSNYNNYGCNVFVSTLAEVLNIDRGRGHATNLLGAIPYDSIMAYVNISRPMMIAVSNYFSPNSGHAMVIAGYDYLPTGPYVWLMDPWTGGFYTVSYSYLSNPWGWFETLRYV